WEECSPCRVYFAATSRPRGSSAPDPGETVADARDREDMARLGRVGLDLAPEVAHMHVDDPRLDRVLVAPDGTEDALPGEHLSGIRRQVREEIELGVCEHDVPLGAGHPALRRVDDQVAKDQAPIGRL